LSKESAMPEQSPRTLILPLSEPVDDKHKLMPAVLQSPVSRGADGEALSLFEGVTVLATYELAGVSRSTEAPQSLAQDLGQSLLALEAEDGSTIVIRADRLMEDVARLCPQALTETGEIDFARFRERDALSRSGLGTWIWKRLSVLSLDKDAILDEALDKAREQLGETLLDKLGDKLVYAASWQGAKALMGAIEGRLAGEPGLYHWQGGALAQSDLCRDAGDSRFAGWDKELGLLFIHGTASHTLGSFGDLPRGEDWEALRRTFGARVFGYEHRSFSESPIDNALALAGVLPKGARICLVTHSRGGLVGDLLCLGGFNAEARRLIDDYRRTPRPDEEEAEANDPALRKLREQVAAEEQDKLRKLVRLLDEKNLSIERYVRVACPAAGTALLSDNLEVFMSGLLNLVRKLGAWGTGIAVGAVATPAAGKVAKEAADQVLRLLGRVVLEIADKRMQPQLVPGIEAMLPEAPMGAFLARAPRRSGIRMAVIAGDIEGGGLLKRIGVMFTDWMLFDRADNDLVVDTGSMYAGLAAGHGAHALFDQGAEVNHFSYFRNQRTRSALRDWLVDEQPDTLKGWTVLPAPGRESREAAQTAERISRGEAQAPAKDTRPVVIFLPGIMGSHLEIDREDPSTPGSGDRIWMDVLDLPRGGLKKIKRDAQGVAPESPLDLAYGALARHLERNHWVIRFPYDWRMEIETAADALAKTVQTALDEHPHQPVRLLAHSMGGLVCRAMIAAHPELWQRMVERPGGRLVMLGTPNHGSHLMVETLLGKSDTIRTLGRIDLVHRLQGVLEIVAAFPGALQLLPQPGFVDTAGPAAMDYFDHATWPKLAEKNDDFWFGRQLGGKPADRDLARAKDFWARVGDHQGAAKPIAPADRVAYVYGYADNTPCGIKVGATRIEMLGTPRGDGSVTWDSGQLDWLPDERCWLMPVDHMGLTSTGDHFDDIVELLTTGSATRLGRLPVARGEAAPPVRPYQPGPVPGFPSEAELVARLVGGHSRPPRPRAPRQVLAVAVKAMDLRFLQAPVLCGHYVGDPISGPEALIDQCLVRRALSKRQRLGVHAGAIGTTSVVLMPRSREDMLRNTGRGAVVVGLGEMGELSSRDITETVRAGVLRLLLHADDRCADENSDTARDDGRGLTLASLLIGFNSTTNISLDESVKAITLGVLEANRQFAQGQAAPAGRRSRRKAARAPMRITRLEFVELYRDAAITAARAVSQLPATLERDLKRLETRIDAAAELQTGKGVRPRLSVAPPSSYWPRLMVADADASVHQCSAECYEIQTINPIPPEVVRQLLTLHGCSGAAVGSGTPVTGQTPAPSIRHAQRLKFVYLGQRARAETVVQQRQPGLVESLVSDVVRSTSYSPEVGLGNTLFQLLVPLDFKAAAREASNLVLVVDGATANIPWEMLEADGEPLVRRTRVVRQLVSARYRQQVRGTREKSALLVVNPDTSGYHAQFGEPDWKPRTKPSGEVEEDRLPSLPGSIEEGRAVQAVLEREGYQVSVSPSGADAGDVFRKLFARPYRILAISAHGMHQVRARDGTWRSGVVLSNGLLLSAAEMGLMEVVPELVFLNCCHLGKMDETDRAAAGSNRLAYSLARELIEMGARCVVASGWEVDDAAGLTFAETFFDRMLRGASFGQAIFEARKQAYEQHPGINTWGAFQAYGDPDYRLEIVDGGGGDDGEFVAQDELLARLDGLRIKASTRGEDERDPEERFRDMERIVSGILRRVSAAWLDRPDVQQALGLLYGEYGALGFAKARAALARAIAEQAKEGAVSLASVEQLANYESRQAERMGRQAIRQLDSEPDKAKEILDAALKLADSAIARLWDLVNMTGATETAPAQANTERQSLLGSAWKRKAALMLAGGQGWQAVQPILKAARDAYANGEGSSEAAGFNPYGMINRLQLDALLGDKAPALASLVALCQAAARRRFVQDYEFFDGVMSVDAELVPWLYADAAVAGLEGMAARYQDAVKDLSATAREFNSVVAQLCLLATFVHARGAARDGERAQGLADVARVLDPDAEECLFKLAPAPEPAPPKRAKPASTARKGKKK
jgi:CHAT domain-containing protein/pimeloyl-ACP methyl ester carboxylesterase